MEQVYKMGKRLNMKGGEGMKHKDGFVAWLDEMVTDIRVIAMKFEKDKVMESDRDEIKDHLNFVIKELNELKTELEEAEVDEGE